MDNTEEKRRIINTSTDFADTTLKSLIAYMYNVQPSDIFDDYSAQKGHIKMDVKSDDNNSGVYKFMLDIVDKDYKLDLGHMLGNKDIQNYMIFLIRCVQVIYHPLKELVNTWAMSNNRQKLEYRNIGIDENSNIYFDIDCDKRIGIIMEKIS